MNQIYFNGAGSYDDWGLRLVSLNISPANPKLHYVDIPAGDSALDLTEALTGDVKYEDRTLEAVLRVDINNYSDKLKMINSAVHGKKALIQTFENPGQYLIGRCTVEFQRLNHIRGNISISARCEPWFYKREVTRHEFNFKDKTKIETSVYNSQRAVIPTFETDEELKVTFKGQSRLMTAGSHQFTGIYFEEGFNDLILEAKEGTTVVIEYQEGVL